MTVAAWVLLVAFGTKALMLTPDFYKGKLSRYGTAIWIASTILVALAAGVIWGGLGG